MLELVFLGTGSGVPMPHRNHSSIYLRYEDTCFLWDCGEGTQKQIFKSGMNFMKVDRIFITHWHADHWAGLIGLLQTMNLEKRTRPLEIYGPEAERFVADILDLDYWGIRFPIKTVNVPFQGQEIATIVNGDLFEILSIPVRHSIPAVAYCFKEKDKVNVDIKKAESMYGLKTGPMVGKLKEKGKIEFKGKMIKLEDVAYTKPGLKVVYTGDTRPCNNVVKLAEKADVLIHEATFGPETDDSLDRAHTRAGDAAETAKAAGVKRLIITHFSRRYQDIAPLVDEARKIFPNTDGAKDFLNLKLKVSD